MFLVIDKCVSSYKQGEKTDHRRFTNKLVIFFFLAGRDVSRHPQVSFHMGSALPV